MSGIVREMLEEEYEFEIPTSMIDVVFLLLIFFMCATRFRSVERKLDAELPQGFTPIGPPPPDEPPEVRVRIFWRNAAGEIVSVPEPGSSVAIHLNRRACADLNELAAVLSELGARNADVGVVIDARRNVPFRWVVGAIDACRRAGIAGIKFQAPAVEGAGGDDWWYM